MEKLDRVRRAYSGNKEGVRRVRALAKSGDILCPYNLNEELVRNVNSLMIDFIEQVLGLRINKADFFLNPNRVIVFSIRAQDRTHRELVSKRLALYYRKKQIIVFNYDSTERLPFLVIVKVLIHEFGHFVARHAVSEKGEIVRHGAVLSKEIRDYGVGLEEAITEELAKRMLGLYFDRLAIPDSEKNWVKSVRYLKDLELSLRFLKIKEGLNIDPDEVLMVGPYSDTHGPSYIHYYSYFWHRKLLYFIIDELAKKKEFGTQEELSKFKNDTMLEFIRYKLKGEAREIAKLVNTALGTKRAFKLLMDIGADDESAREFYGYFKKQVALRDLSL